MKKQIIISGLLLVLLSCGKEKQTAAASDKNQSSITNIETEKDSSETKSIVKTIFENTDKIIESKELDLTLLSKVAENLKINYSDIKIDETSAVSYDDKISFFVICIIQKSNGEIKTEDEEDLGDYFDRKYVFADKKSGKIIAEESDNDLGYSDNEGVRFSKTYILKDPIQLSESTNGIAFYTESYASSHVVLYSEQIFSIITLVDGKIKKILYEYPIRLTNGDSNGSGTFQVETLETGLRVSNNKTNGFYDLLISKNFTYEEEAEADLEKGIKEKSNIKNKKEAQIIKYNGKIYAFDKDDRHRFL